MLTLNYKDGKSLHEQIEEGLKELIVNGIIAENEQLPSVRELSVSLTVNPNTVQRAYRDLERDGFIVSVHGKGSFVAPSERVRESEAVKLYEKLTSTVKELAFLGEERQSIINVVNNVFSEREEQV